MPTQKEELQLNTQQDMSSEDMYVLKKLFTEYVSLYRLELNSGKYEILRLIENTNAKKRKRLSPILLIFIILAALTAADKCQPSEIHVASVISFLDRRRENNYNAT